MSDRLTNQKPCPWCGGQPVTEEWRKSKFVTENGHVCPECWFIGCENKCFFASPRAHYGTEAEALAIWNKRSE